MTEYYVLTSAGSNLVNQTGEQVQYRFKVGGEMVSISKYVRTFRWFHPIRQTVDIHEFSTGLYLGGHADPKLAEQQVKAVFQGVPEDVFFETLKRQGSVKLRPEISFDEAIKRIRKYMDEEAVKNRQFRDRIPFLPPGYQKVYCGFHQQVHFAKKDARPCRKGCEWKVLQDAS